jgi:hypothetical protein
MFARCEIPAANESFLLRAQSHPLLQLQKHVKEAAASVYLTLVSCQPPAKAVPITEQILSIISQTYKSVAFTTNAAAAVAAGSG